MLRSLAGQRPAFVGLLMLMALVAGALLGPFFVADPTAQDLSQRLRPPALFVGDGSSHPLGTDALGRDVLSRLLNGARLSLLIPSAGVVLSALLGTTVGITAAYSRGWVDDVVMRVVDVQLAVPYLLLTIVILSLLGPGTQNVIIVLMVNAWVLYARVARSQVLSIREREFIIAARSIGATGRRIIIRHVVPNILGTLITLSTIVFAELIFLESALGYLGLGVPPPTPTWGRMIAEGQVYLTTGQWWITVLPGILLVLTILSVYWVGDWLRDILDPHRAAPGPGRVRRRGRAWS